MKLANYDIKVANTFFKRLLGLMFKKEINYGLLFKDCNKIHTCFMRFNIDVIGIKDNKVIFIKENIKPWKIVIIKEKGIDVLEIKHNNKLNFKLKEKITIQQ